jgi:hypothetical protein
VADIAPGVFDPSAFVVAAEVGGGAFLSASMSLLHAARPKAKAIAAIAIGCGGERGVMVRPFSDQDER